MARIGIDMRMAGTGEGIGRYIEELVSELMNIDSKNQYVLIFQESSDVEGMFRGKKKNFETYFSNSPYYSWAEQTQFVSELNSLDLDLVHFASFNVPLFYRGRFVTTIHDMIHHHFPGTKKSHLIYRVAYKVVMRNTIHRAKKIMTVSKATKRDIMKLYKVSTEKFAFTHEGVNKKFRERANSGLIQAVKDKYKISKPYILFVGVWRRYKNLPLLAKAFDILKERYRVDVELVLAGKVDGYNPQIKKEVFAIKHSDSVVAPGFIDDEDLPALYQGARIFALPSLIEGFGLIGVEAQASGIPVAASDIAVLREVLGAGAIYFDPKSPQSIARSVAKIIQNSPFADKLSKLGLENTKDYDWAKTAERTLSIYKEAMRK